MKIQLSIGITDMSVGEPNDGYKVVKELILLAKAGILQRYSSRINYVNIGGGDITYSNYKESCTIDVAEEEKTEKPMMIVIGK